EKQTIIHSISDLDLDKSQGRLSPEDHQRLRAVEEIRLGKALDRLEALEASASKKSAEVKPAGMGLKSVSTLTLFVLVIGTSWLVYEGVEGRIGLEAKKHMSQSGTPSPPSQGMPDPIKMVERLEKRLAENPNDLEGQIMAGRSYMTLNRFEDAKKAWGKVIDLDFGNHEAHYLSGVLILQTTPRSDTASLIKAVEHFDTALVKVPREPAVLWYRGVAMVHLKEYAQADENWTTAYQNLNPGSEDAEFVKESLQKLRAGNPPLY
ncbi:MAG TPA: hypothetical protein VIU33_03705, partial [Nitrospiria bacterium]